MLDKYLRYGKLYDYYSDVLNEKHKKVINQYYLMDLSLREISENLGITRQGVYDLLKRAEKNLDEIDSKLNIIKKQEKFKNNIQKKAEEINKNIEKKDYKDLKKHFNELVDLINKL
ncbi:MAG: sigma factor-like helix-turn-helix DNA-binding protein [Eubacteriales bacterium]